MVILDTSVIIDHLRRPRGAGTVLLTLAQKMPKEDLAISMVTVHELYEGRSTREKGKEDALLASISPLRVLPYTYEIAQTAGELAREIDHPIDFPDAAIAATAIVHGALLVTLDTKSFKGIQGLEFYAE